MSKLWNEPSSCEGYNKLFCIFSWQTMCCLSLNGTSQGALRTMVLAFTQHQLRNHFQSTFQISRTEPPASRLYLALFPFIYLALDFQFFLKNTMKYFLLIFISRTGMGNTTFSSRFAWKEREKLASHILFSFEDWEKLTIRHAFTVCCIFLISHSKTESSILWQMLC